MAKITTLLAALSLFMIIGVTQTANAGSCGGKTKNCHCVHKCDCGGTASNCDCGKKNPA